MKLNKNLLNWTIRLSYAIIILSVLQAVAFKGLINAKVLLTLLAMSILWLLIVELLVRRKR